MSSIDKLQTTQVSNRTAAIVIVIFAVVVVCAVVLVKNHLSAPVETAKPESKTQTIASAKIEKHKSAKAVGPSAKETDTSQPVDACSIIIHRNVFKPILKPAAGKPGADKTVPPMPFRVLPAFPGGPLGMPGQTAGSGQDKNRIAYTGIVQTPEATMALLENPETNETRYAGVGDLAFGMVVTDINPRYVSLNAMGRSIRLAMGENKKDTPSTPPAGTPAQGGQPPAQGASGSPGTPGAPGTPSTQPATPAFGQFTPGAFGGQNSNQPRRGTGRRRSQ